MRCVDMCYDADMIISYRKSSGANYNHLFADFDICYDAEFAVYGNYVQVLRSTLLSQKNVNRLRSTTQR